jgi:2-keto-4-pentenoate hydratase/2-oxohepta-3-ene-1,7-dioic acid hydratase in catechol pathway
MYLVRIARVALPERVVFGRIEGTPGNEELLLLAGDVLAGEAQPEGREHYRLADVRLLPPVRPSKIVAVGRNYADHAVELAHDIPERPRVFLKPPSSLIAHGDSIRYPKHSQEVHHEAELAVVVGRKCRDVAPEDAQRFVAGFTCANDVTARDIQRAEGLPSYAKAFDTFCPLGPWIETDFDPGSARITCTVNDDLRQDGNSRNMLWNVPDLIAYVTAAMTLLPGDILLTGTPAGVGPVQPGDIVTVTIEGIGSLRNPVAADQT